HAHQSHAATHILESTVRPPPVQALTELAREPVATERRGHRDQFADELDLRGSKMTCAVLHRSTRIAQAQGLFVGAQRFNRFVKTHPAALSRLIFTATVSGMLRQLASTKSSR